MNPGEHSHLLFIRTWFNPQAKTQAPLARFLTYPVLQTH